jgi:hypothetical protein
MPVGAVVRDKIVDGALERMGTPNKLVVGLSIRSPPVSLRSRWRPMHTMTSGYWTKKGRRIEDLWSVAKCGSIKQLAIPSSLELWPRL